MYVSFYYRLTSSLCSIQVIKESLYNKVTGLYVGFEKYLPYPLMKLHADSGCIQQFGFSTHYCMLWLGVSVQVLLFIIYYFYPKHNLW